MILAEVKIQVPAEMAPFVDVHDTQSELMRNAMMLYPYILEKRISHGRAAEILGIHKLDLIDLYGRMGFCYFDQTQDELEEDLQVFAGLELNGVRV